MNNSDGSVYKADEELIENLRQESSLKRKGEEQLFTSYTYFVREGMHKHALSEDEAFDFLTPKGYVYGAGQDEERMHNIHQYVYEHFTEPIVIKEIAAVANMTETSFCRYFKTRTLKHFTQFVNEIRIAYSCRLLNNNNYTVTHACFESGFNSLSYFNRQFKQVMKVSPQQYQKWKKAAVN